MGGVEVDPILFLDIDGVLNTHEFDPDVLCGQIHRDKVGLLNGILRATGAKVVLSSAWRYILYRGESNLMGLEWLLRSHGMLAGRLVGITRPDTMVRGDTYSGRPNEWPQANERGRQITDWLEANGGLPRRYVVIDDMDLGIKEAGHPFVQTEPTVGLTRDDAERAVRILSGVGEVAGEAA